MKKMKSLGRLAAIAAISVVMMAGFMSCGDKSDMRDPFIGIYNARYSYVYNGVQYFSDYILTVSKSATDDNMIVMSNISDYYYVNARATVQGSSFSIPQQTFISLGISGSGQLNGNTLTFSTSETHTDYAGAINVSHTATKQ